MFRRLLITVFVSVLLTGCNTLQPIHNISSTSLSDIVTTSEHNVHKAITLAINKRGWHVDKDKPGMIEASIKVRHHSATIGITYSPTGYNIAYKNSVNLDHKGDNIHRNYNKWVILLDREIQQQLLAL